MNHDRQGLVLKYELGFALARPCIFTKVIIDLILIFSLNVELSCVTQKKRLELQTSSRRSLTIITAGLQPIMNSIQKSCANLKIKKVL